MKDNFTPKRVLVIGEHCLDVYISGSVSRLNPEAPTPILSQPIAKKIVNGMASNVAANLEALGEHVRTIQNPTPIVKTRYCDSISGYILLRVDEGDTCEERNDYILYKTKELVDSGGVDCVVISDYNKGLVTETTISQIGEHCNNKVLTFLDTKKILGAWSKHIDIIKINNKEFIENCEKNKGVLFNYYNKYLIVTNGAKETRIYDKDSGESPVFSVPVEAGSVINVCGAGDSVLSGLVFYYSRTQDIKESVKFSNKCGTIACGYFGTHVFNKKDLEMLKFGV